MVAMKRTPAMERSVEERIIPERRIGMPNPAAVHAVNMGYDLRYEKDQYGNTSAVGYRTINGKEERIDVWDLYDRTYVRPSPPASFSDAKRQFESGVPKNKIVWQQPSQRYQQQSTQRYQQPPQRYQQQSTQRYQQPPQRRQQPISSAIGGNSFFKSASMIGQPKKQKQIFYRRMF